MDEKGNLDPETEKSVQEALDQAVEDVRKDGINSMAAYMRTTYNAYRACGFGRAASFAFTMVMYKAMVNR